MRLLERNKEWHDTQEAAEVEVTSKVSDGSAEAVLLACLDGSAEAMLLACFRNS